MARRRDKAFIPVSYVKKLLAGDAHCEWAAWFKANFQDFEKMPSEFDLDKWRLDHSALLAKVLKIYEDAGATVFLEYQNNFVIDGTKAKFSGRPDLVIVQGNELIICDVKTGRHNLADRVQVLLYMWGFPKKFPDVVKDLSIRGEIVYSDGEHIVVPIEELTEDFEKRFASLMNRLSSIDEPRLVPSVQECRYCDITKADCASRIDSEDQPVKTTLF